MPGQSKLSRVRPMDGEAQLGLGVRLGILRYLTRPEYTETSSEKIPEYTETSSEKIEIRREGTLRAEITLTKQLLL